MLWFDNSPSTLTVKLQRAVDYYTKKYGRTPDLILLHPSLIEKEKLEIEGLTIRPYRPVLPGHIWVGIEDTQS
jgi:hypothetical protein